MRAGSLALGYPDAQWRQDLPLLHATADAVAGPAQAHLRSFLSAVAGLPGRGAAAGLRRDVRPAPPVLPLPHLLQLR